MTIKEIHIGPDRVLIVNPMENAQPMTGLFKIKRRRGGLYRALSVRCEESLWTVFLDGAAVATSSENWGEAFGDLCRNNMLIGIPISFQEYEILIGARMRDRLEGRDVEGVMDKNDQPTTF